MLLEREAGQASFGVKVKEGEALEAMMFREKKQRVLKRSNLFNTLDVVGKNLWDNVYWARRKNVDIMVRGKLM